MVADLKWFIDKYFFFLNGFVMESKEKLVEYVKEGRFKMDGKIMTLDDLNIVPDNRVKIELTHDDGEVGEVEWNIY